MSNTRKDNGDGCIQLRSDGRWVAIIQVGKTKDGKPKKKYIYAASQREVKKKLREYKREMARGYNEVCKFTLNEYLDKYIKTYKEKTLKPSSYDRLENTINNHIRDTLGYIQIGNITADDIQCLINEKSESLSYSSVKKIVEALNPCFRHAVIVGDLPRNPIDGVRLPKQSQMPVTTKHIEEYTESEIEAINQQIQSSFNDKRKLYRYSPIYIFMLNTGIRLGEALALTWEDIDFDKKQVVINKNVSSVKDRSPKKKRERKLIVNEPKTQNSNRIVPLNSNAISALNEIKRRNKTEKIQSNYVVCNANGNIVTPNNFARTFVRLLTKAGIESKGIHALRHTFGSRALRCGVDIKVISELLGHSNINITYNHYIHVIKEQKIQAVELLENL